MKRSRRSTVLRYPGTGFTIFDSAGTLVPIPHTHADVEVLVVASGWLRQVHVGGGTTLRAGGMQCLWAGLPHGAVAAAPATSCIVINLAIDRFTAHPGGMALVQHLLRGGCLVGRDAAHVQRAAGWLRDFSAHDPVLNHLVQVEAETWLLRMAHHQVPRNGSRATEDLAGNTVLRRHAQRMTDFVLAECDRIVEVAQVARHVGLDHRYALGVFREVMGMSLWQFVIQVRITRAMSLLADPAHGVVDVAFTVGFATTSSFYTAFNRIVGMTPSRYRQRAVAMAG
jgi:AraC-like DNA-binding protein